MKYLIITRPQEDAERLAHFVKIKGFEPIVEPLLNPIYMEDLILMPPKVQAVMITSKHALRAIESSNQTAAFQNIPFICVGEKTTALAKGMGLQTVSEHFENVDKLTEWVKENIVPEVGPLVYLHGDVTTKNLKDTLGEHGFSVQNQRAYQMNEAQMFSHKTMAIIKRQVLHGIAFFSPRTGRIFVNISQNFGLHDYLSVVNALCLSQAVADEVKVIPWKSIQIAKNPKEEAFLELL